jgi:hypothetical protein
MINFYRSILVVAVLLLTIPCHNTAAHSSVVNVPEGNGISELSWNRTNHEAPFQRSPSNAQSKSTGQIVYSSGDFTFPLLQSLSYDSECNCYSLIVSSTRRERREIVQFWPTRSGFYRTANGPYLELENFDSLRAVTDLNGTRFLFAQVGDGEWRCVSIHDPAGPYLLVDYRADGLISQLRDSFSRTATPTYDGDRLQSLTQTWTNRSGRTVRSIVQ